MRLLFCVLSLEARGGDGDRSGDGPKDMEDDMEDLCRPVLEGSL